MASKYGRGMFIYWYEQLLGGWLSGIAALRWRYHLWHVASAKGARSNLWTKTKRHTEQNKGDTKHEERHMRKYESFVEGMFFSITKDQNITDL